MATDKRRGCKAAGHAAPAESAPNACPLQLYSNTPVPIRRQHKEDIPWCMLCTLWAAHTAARVLAPGTSGGGAPDAGVGEGAQMRECRLRLRVEDSVPAAHICKHEVVGAAAVPQVYR